MTHAGYSGSAWTPREEPGGRAVLSGPLRQVLLVGCDTKTGSLRTTRRHAGAVNSNVSHCVSQRRLYEIVRARKGTAVTWVGTCETIPLSNRSRFGFGPGGTGLSRPDVSVGAIGKSLQARWIHWICSPLNALERFAWTWNRQVSRLWVFFRSELPDREWAGAAHVLSGGCSATAGRNRRTLEVVRTSHDGCDDQGASD